MSESKKRILLLVTAAALTLFCLKKTVLFIQDMEKSADYFNAYAPTLRSSQPLTEKESKTLSSETTKTKLTPEKIHEGANYLVKVVVFQVIAIPFTDQTMLQYAGFGSGSVVECEQYKFCVLTANHVINIESTIFFAEFRDGSLPQKLELLSNTTTYDAAVLRFTDNNFQPKKTAMLGQSHKLKAGTPIVALGSSSFGNFWINAEGSLHAKIGPPDEILKPAMENSGLDRPKYIFMSTKLFHGYSGGPLINNLGEVIGIGTNILSLDDGELIYIGSPIEEIKEALPLIK